MLLDVQEGRWFGEQFKQKTLKEMFDRYEKEYTVIKPYYRKRGTSRSSKTCTAFLVKIVLSAKSKISSVAMKYTDAIRRKAGNHPERTVAAAEDIQRCAEAVEMELDNPVSEIELPKVSNNRVRYLSQDEYSRASGCHACRS